MTANTFHSSRIQFKPAGSDRGSVDGAWWPHTRDLAGETRAIARDVGEHLQRLERVGYALRDWDTSDTTRIAIDGQRISLEGFTVWTPATVRFTGASSTLTLAVIPPDTDPRTAREIMTRATHRHSTRSASALLGPQA
ncbi:DUF5994 family protein [Gordonia sp. ABKF26]|uniref:DUF5994 family protein n=1 Tax=Gordonia sp. ABKF26 TaxID=3238687 RepID=UPI0034E4C6A2